MRKSLSYKILAALMAAGSFGLYAATPAAAEENFNAPDDGTTIVNGTYDNVYGNGTPITITGGTIGYVYGVNKENYPGDVSGGNVTINGNAEVTYVFGGYSDSKIDVTNNYVTINNSTISNDVYGGYSYGHDSDGGNTNGNNVIINNSSATNVYGGFWQFTDAEIQRSDNTLILDGWSGTAKSIYYFENIEFKNTTFTNGTVLNSQEQSNLAGLKNIKITNFAGGQNFNKGETLTLIKNTNNTNNTTINEQNFNATAGVAVDVGGVIKQDVMLL